MFTLICRHVTYKTNYSISKIKVTWIIWFIKSSTKFLCMLLWKWCCSRDFVYMFTIPCHNHTALFTINKETDLYKLQWAFFCILFTCNNCMYWCYDMYCKKMWIKYCLNQIGSRPWMSNGKARICRQKYRAIDKFDLCSF